MQYLSSQSTFSWVSCSLCTHISTEKIETSSLTYLFEEPDVGELNNECQQLLQTLPTEKWRDGCYLFLSQGFSFRAKILQGIIHFQEHFKAEEDDVFIITPPKSGTTWLKALTFAVANRKDCPLAQSPLLTSNPHELVRTLEMELYFMETENPNLQDLPRPRFLTTHLPYHLLPLSIKDSKCRIVGKKIQFPIF